MAVAIPIEANLKNHPATVVREPRRWMILVGVIVAAMTVSLDGGIMGLIAPSVSAEFSATPATINFISSLSTLMMAAFILGGGILGDIYGRKRILSIGLMGLVINSIFGMLTPNIGTLLVVRAVAGIMDALVNPMALAIIMVSFDTDERPRAFGYYAAAMGLTSGLGMIMISFLNQQFGWRSTFAVVFVMGTIALVTVWRFVEESKADIPIRMDWLGVALAALGLLGITFGVNQGGSNGLMSREVLVPVIFGLMMIFALVLYSRKSKYPALRLALFQNRIFSIGLILTLLMNFAASGTFFFLSTYLQSLQKVSPIQAAITLLPYTLSLFAFAILAGRLVGKFANRLLVGGGLGVMVCGLVILAIFLSPTAGFWTYLLPLVLIGAGFSIANVPRTTLVLSTAPPALAGSASATNNASSCLGASLGIALLGTIFQSTARAAYTSDLTAVGLSSDQIAQSVKILSAWLQQNSGDIASQFGITVQQLTALIENYEAAYTTGIAYVLWIAAAVVAAGAVLAAIAFNRDRQAREQG